MEKLFDEKLSKMYFSLIERAKNRVLRGYSERHHIIPKSLGGVVKDKSNIVRLTGREHLIAHKLLYRMVLTKNNKFKMACALHRMRNPTHSDYILSSKEFERIRIIHAKEISQNRIGIKFSVQHRANISKVVKGRKLSDSCCTKMSKSRTGKPRSEETKNKVSEGLKAMWIKRKTGLIPTPKAGNKIGFLHSEETKAKMSDSHKKRNQLLSGRTLINTGNLNEALSLPLTKETS